jgi:gamma-glutamyltranspeptidase/glutathione hydrolase
MPRGRAPLCGERFIFADAAQTLHEVAETCGRALYEGELAEKIVAHSRENGGAMSLEDLREYQPDWLAPISTSYRDYDVQEIPPNGQGTAALMALGILKQFDVGNLAVDSADSQHLQIEAMKLAFADLYRYVSDTRSMEVAPAEMLSDDYLAERAAQIDLKKAAHLPFGTPAAGGTVYLSGADESGMMVSFIQSNYMGFGSGVVGPGTGISMQNRGVGFSMDPQSSNVVAGGKRLFHTIIPGFLTHTGRSAMSFGVMGGDIQPQGHVQTLVCMLNYQQQPQAACDAPRWKVNRDFTLDVEGTMRPAIVAAFQARGHELKRIEDPYMDFGSGQFVWRLSEDPEDGYVAASDSRRDGQAAGF